MGKVASLKLISNQISPSLKRIRTELSKVPKEALDKFKAATPVKSGNARRRTRLQNNTIVADYPYATDLDMGKSPKAPQGMSKPTEQYITKRVNNIMRKQ